MTTFKLLTNRCIHRAKWLLTSDAGGPGKAVLSHDDLVRAFDARSKVFVLLRRAFANAAEAREAFFGSPETGVYVTELNGAAVGRIDIEVDAEGRIVFVASLSAAASEALVELYYHGG